MFLPPQQLLDTWWIDRASVLISDFLFLDTFSIPQLSTTFSRHLPQQLLQHLLIPHLSSITIGSIFTSFTIRLSFLRSLSICPCLFISQTLSFSLPTSSSRFLQAFSSSSTLGKLLIPHYSCISCFKTQVFGFFEKFWGFSKLMSV